MAEEDEPIIKVTQINDALGRYYKLRGKEYNNEFLAYCQENGFEDESLKDEFDEKPEDCMLAQFDDNFPFESVVDDSQKQIIIVSIIQQCYDDPSAFSSLEKEKEEKNDGVSIPEIDGKFFSLSKRDHKSSKDLLKTQVSVLYNNGMEKDNSIQQIVAVGHKNNIPYINYLADMYSRDLAEGVITGKDPAQWLEAHPHYVTLRNIKTENNSKPAEVTTAGITSYFHRVCPRLILPPAYKVSDSLEQTAKLMISIISFVNNLASNGSILPFQLDACIGFGHVKGGNIGDDDDGADIEEDDDNDDDHKFEFKEVIGDIQKKLDSNKLKNVKVTIKGDRTVRIIDDAFNKLKNDEIKGKFPKNERFCGLIDRRTKKKDNTLFMWQSPGDCRDIPSSHVPEWYFNASSATIIPHEQYNNGKDQKNANNINSQNKCNGGVMILSFHVEAVDEIRCYLYANGQMSRFMPQDIIGLLPKLFDMEYEGNKKFIEGKAAEQLAKSVKIPDIRFEKFCAYVSKSKKSKK